MLKWKCKVVRSEALRAAAVSVVKSGFPVPAPTPPNMTTLPFSRCLIARCLLYGSATSGIENVLWTRAWTPSFSKADWSKIEFITVAIILVLQKITYSQDAINSMFLQRKKRSWEAGCTVKLILHHLTHYTHTEHNLINNSMLNIKNFSLLLTIKRKKPA